MNEYKSTKYQTGINYFTQSARVKREMGDDVNDPWIKVGAKVIDCD